MPREYHFWVYVLASRSRNLYVGMTNSIHTRTAKHREGTPGSHTAHYNIHRLIYFEYFRYVRNAIARETELKGWTRAQKIELIEKINPTWEDLKPPQLGAILRSHQTIASLRDEQQQKQNPHLRTITPHPATLKPWASSSTLPRAAGRPRQSPDLTLYSNVL